MFQRTGEDAYRTHGRDDAALRSLSGSPPCGHKESGMTEEELDAAVDVIAALDAGVLQSLNQKISRREIKVNSEIGATRDHNVGY